MASDNSEAKKRIDRWARLYWGHDALYFFHVPHFPYVEGVSDDEFVVWSLYLRSIRNGPDHLAREVVTVWKYRDGVPYWGLQWHYLGDYCHVFRKTIQTKRNPFWIVTRALLRWRRKRLQRVLEREPLVADLAKIIVGYLQP